MIMTIGSVMVVICEREQFHMKSLFFFFFIIRIQNIYISCYHRRRQNTQFYDEPKYKWGRSQTQNGGCERMMSFVLP